MPLIIYRSLNFIALRLSSTSTFLPQSSFENATHVHVHTYTHILGFPILVEHYFSKLASLLGFTSYYLHVSNVSFTLLISTGGEPFERCQSYIDKPVLNRHMATIRKEKLIFKCNECDYICDKKRNLTYHAISDSSDKTFSVLVHKTLI